MSGILEVLRVEKKYSLSLQEVLSLKGRLNQVMQADSYSHETGGYTVRSLYFDTPDDKDYREKEDGIEQRRKIRLRTYGGIGSSVKLELKEKQGEFQRKRSLIMDRSDAKELTEGNMAVLHNYRNELAEEIYGIMMIHLYRPKCMVEYNRTAFSVQENDIRITLDTKLRASETDFDLFSDRPSYYPVDIADKGILEVKYNRFLLSYVKEILTLSEKSQTSNSKYCMARRISRGI